MNRFHRWYCRQDAWARRLRGELLPWALRDVDVSGRVVEVGPGPGLTSAELAPGAALYVAVELDAELARQARARAAAAGARVVRGDGAALPLPAASVDVAICFTMLHHVPTSALQDAILAEMARVLRPGGIVAGSDSRPSLRFRLIHVGDTMNVVDPATLPARLRAAGFEDVHADAGRSALRWRARRPVEGRVAPATLSE